MNTLTLGCWLVVVVVVGYGQYGLSIGPEPKTELREGYGILYQYLGGLFHGLNKYWLIIGFQMPKLYYKSNLNNLPDEFCDELDRARKGTSLLGYSCKETWQVIMRNKDRTKLLQDELDHLIGFELPAVLPGFHPEDMGMDLSTEAFQDRDDSLSSEDREDREFLREGVEVGLQGMDLLQWAKLKHSWKNRFDSTWNANKLNPATSYDSESSEEDRDNRTPKGTPRPVVRNPANRNPGNPSGIRGAGPPAPRPTSRSVNRNPASRNPGNPSGIRGAPAPRNRQSRQGQKGQTTSRNNRRSPRMGPITRQVSDMRQQDYDRQTDIDREQVDFGLPGVTTQGLNNSGDDDGIFEGRVKRDTAQNMTEGLTEKEKVMDFVIQVEKLRKRQEEKTRPRMKRETGQTQTGSEEVHERQKRWLFDLFGLAMDGVNMYLDHKSRKKVEKGIEELKKRMGKMEGRIDQVEDEMISLAEATFKDISRIMDILGHVQEELQYIYWSLDQIKFHMALMEARLQDLEAAFIFVTDVFTNIIDFQEREIDLLMHLITELNHILDAIDNLSNGYLSHSVVPPYVLAKLIQKVRETLIINFPEFELVIDQVHQYFNIPIGSFTYQNGILAVQVPLLVKPKLQEPLMLYQIKTIPVPYHMNLDMVEAEENRFAHTKLELDKPLLAMSKDTYIDLRDQDLTKCMQIAKTYYCQDLFLMRHKHFHTCGSAIYFRQSPENIRKLCDFQYYPHLIPTPELLDEGKRILLSGLPEGWTYYCSHDEQIPSPVRSGDYVIVPKTDLCRCSISAGPWYIQENMAYCIGELDTEFSFYYTSNMAVMIHMFREQIESMNITDISLYLKPLPLDPEEPEILMDNSKDVYRGRLDLSDPLAMEQVMENVERKKENKKRPRYRSKADKMLLNNEWDEWFDEDSEDHSFGFLFSASILVIIVAVVVVLLMLGYCALRGRMHRIDSSIGRIIGLGSLASKIGSTKGCTIDRIHFDKSSMSWMLTCADGNEWNLHCGTNYVFESLFGLLKLVGYVILIHAILFLLLKSFQYLKRKCSGHNLDPIRSGGLFAFTDRNKSEIVMVLTNRSPNGRTSKISVLLGYFLGDISKLTVDGKLRVGEVTYESKWFWTYVHISWTSLTIRHQSLPLDLPVHIQLTFLDSLVIKMITNKFCYQSDQIDVQLYTRNVWFQVWKELTSESVVLLPGGLGLPDGLELTKLPDTLAAAAKKISKGKSDFSTKDFTNEMVNEAYDKTSDEIDHYNKPNNTKADVHKEYTPGAAIAIYPGMRLKELERAQAYEMTEIPGNQTYQEIGKVVHEDETKL